MRGCVFTPKCSGFDYGDGDPVKNASPLGNKTASVADMTSVGEDGEDLPPSLSMNLETRRKRKEGEPKLKIRRNSLLPQSPVKNESEAAASTATATSTIMRTGAKRKLADREMEREKDKSVRPPSASDFTFSRRAVTTDEAKKSDKDDKQIKNEVMREKVTCLNL